jgi:septin family protein
MASRPSRRLPDPESSIGTLCRQKRLGNAHPENNVPRPGNNEPAGHAQNNVPRPPAPAHAKDLQPHERPAPPNTGDPNRDKKYQQQQDKLYQKQEQDHQKLAQKQEQQHQQLAQQNANEAKKQQVEQKHQQQTQQMEQKHTQQQEKMQTKQGGQAPQGGHKAEPK